MKQLLKWTTKSLLLIIEVMIAVYISLLILEVRDYYCIQSEDPIWEFVWFIVSTAVISVLLDITINKG